MNWLFASIVRLPEPKSPAAFVKKNEILAAASLGFAMAMPVFTDPLTSAAARPDDIAGAAAKVVSDTVTPLFFELSTATPAGRLSLPEVRTVAYPVVVTVPTPGLVAEAAPRVDMENRADGWM